jgi:hypothetical protein
MIKVHDDQPHAEPRAQTLRDAEKSDGISAARNSDACNVTGPKHVMPLHGGENALLKIIS